MSKPQGSNKEMFDATRQKFIEKAHDRFISDGYVSTSTNDIVRDAEMARGALYHHFKNKEDLFAAVLEYKAATLQKALQDQLEKRAYAGTADTEEDFYASLDLVIDLFKDPSYRRILVIEVQVALPHERRRAAMNDYYYPLFIDFFSQLDLQNSLEQKATDAIIIGLIGFISENIRSLEYARSEDELTDIANTIKSSLRLLMKPFIEAHRK